MQTKDMVEGKITPLLDTENLFISNYKKQVRHTDWIS